MANDGIAAIKTDLNVAGLLGMLVFYAIIFVSGLMAHKVLKRGGRAEIQKKNVAGATEDMMLAGRDISYFIGVFTMTATWVGGGYINGAAEAVIKNGLVWCQAPFCYAISLFCGGCFFATKMRNGRHVTMLDPLQNKYGKVLGSFFYIPAFSGEILWSASILAALGTSLRVICGLSDPVSIIISACIAMTYTLFGGLYSVAFTDVVQLFCIFIGLVFSIPFMTTHDAVTIPLKGKGVVMYYNEYTTANFTLSMNGTKNAADYPAFTGKVAQEYAGVWVDYAIMMICGGIPWQAYFQRVLSSRNASVARVLSFAAALGCFLAAIPSVVIGLITINTDWMKTELEARLGYADYKLAVPLCLLYLTHPAVAFIGLGAVSAAVMSSTDSSILGISSMFTRNVFKGVFWRDAPDTVTLWFLRGAILLNTCIAMLIAIFVKSVYGLYLICSDLVFILLFPHLTLVVHFPQYTNRYGMIAGFWLAFFLRILAGEPVLKYNAILKYPFYKEPVYYSDTDVLPAGSEVGDIVSYGSQVFPFRILVMLINLLVTLLVSFLFKTLFTKVEGMEKYDILGAVMDSKYEKVRKVQDKEDKDESRM